MILRTRKRKAKKLSLCHKLWFSNPFTFATKGRIDLRYFYYEFCQIKWSSLKYQRFTPYQVGKIGIKKFDFVAKNPLFTYNEMHTVCIDILFHSYFNFKFKIFLTYHERLKINYLQQKVWKREYERSSFNGRKLRLTDNQYPQLTLIWFRQEINFLVFFKKTYMMQDFNPIWNLLEINVRRSQKHEGI